MDGCQFRPSTRIEIGSRHRQAFELKYALYSGHDIHGTRITSVTGRLVYKDETKQTFGQLGW